MSREQDYKPGINPSSVGAFHEHQDKIDSAKHQKSLESTSSTVVNDGVHFPYPEKNSELGANTDHNPGHFSKHLERGNSTSLIKNLTDKHRNGEDISGWER